MTRVSILPCQRKKKGEKKNKKSLLACGGRERGEWALERSVHEGAHGSSFRAYIPWAEPGRVTKGTALRLG